MTLTGYTDTKRINRIEANAEEMADELRNRNLSTHLEFDPVEDLNVLFIDRSGSIVQDGIEQIEDTVLTLGLALEDLGCKVCIVDIYNCESRLISQFDDSLDESYGNILTGEVQGSTPVKDAIKTVREESMYFNEQDMNAPITSFIAFTDGLPDDENGTAEQLNTWGVHATAVIPLSASHTNSVHDKVPRIYDDYTIVRDDDQWNFLAKQAWLHNTLFKTGN